MKKIVREPEEGNDWAFSVCMYVAEGMDQPQCWLSTYIYWDINWLSFGWMNKKIYWGITDLWKIWKEVKMLLAKWCQELEDDGVTLQIFGDIKNLVKRYV